MIKNNKGFKVVRFISLVILFFSFTYIFCSRLLFQKFGAEMDGLPEALVGKMDLLPDLLMELRSQNTYFLFSRI